MPDIRGMRGVPIVGVLPSAFAGSQPERALLELERRGRLRIGGASAPAPTLEPYHPPRLRLRGKRRVTFR